MLHVWGRYVEAVGSGALSYGASLAGNKRGRAPARLARGKGGEGAAAGVSRLLDGIASPASERRQVVRG